MKKLGNIRMERLGEIVGDGVIWDAHNCECSGVLGDAYVDQQSYDRAEFCYICTDFLAACARINEMKSGYLPSKFGGMDPVDVVAWLCDIAEVDPVRVSYRCCMRSKKHRHSMRVRT